MPRLNLKVRGIMYEGLPIPTQILSVVMRSLLNNTRAFLLSRSICLGVGIPILKDAEKKGKILKYILNIEEKIV